MCREPKSSSEQDWRPSASREALLHRAQLLAALRTFFAERGVLEVETPLLSAATVPDLHLHSLSCRLEVGGTGRQAYLQTSPEFAMKRLLAAGSGAIFQICKAFRDGEVGARHNPEFTMLEWYRPGFDHHRLMDEMDEMLAAILGVQAAERLTYGEAMRRHASVDPHRDSPRQLQRAAAMADIEIVGAEPTDRDDWLHLLMSHLVEPRLGHGRPSFIYDYPVSQAALARIRTGDPAVAERFEIYVEGVELANGFHELTDPVEQRQRFESDLELRRQAGLPAVPLDERLLAALEEGLPDCAGVALGVDRLAMLRGSAREVSEVISFSVDRA